MARLGTYAPIRGTESGKNLWKKSSTSLLVTSFSNSSKGMNNVHVKDLFCEERKSSEKETRRPARPAAA